MNYNDNVQSDVTNTQPTSKHEWLIRVSLLATSLLVCLLLLELGARIYWKFGHGVPMRQPDKILYAFYPGLKEIDQRRPVHEDERYDVLFLGGSVLHEQWGSVEKAFGEQLANSGRHDVRIYNLAEPGHSSRDSLLKYRHIDTSRFDVVIVYHGINETRANNVPAERFQDDYGHYAWYETVNRMADYHKRAKWALPYSFQFLAMQMRQSVFSGQYVPINTPHEAWTIYGENILSAGAFEQNLTEIIETAEARHDPIQIMTFATYVPEDYSLQAFNDKNLDYVLHADSPIEIWGRRENVEAGVSAHNAVIRQLAQSYPAAIFIDQDTLISGTPRYFNDPCHLTIAGSISFAEHIVARLP